MQKNYSFADITDGCEKWSLISRREYKLGDFDRKTHRRVLVFWPTTHKITGNWRNYINEFHDSYSWSYVIRRERWEGHPARMRGKQTQDPGGDMWKSHFENLTADGRMILRKRMGGHGLDLSGSGERDH